MKAEFKKYLFEFVVIFLSITLSFVVEEWRTNNQQQKVVREFLIRLKNELKSKSEKNKIYLKGNALSMSSYQKIFNNFTTREIRNDSLLRLCVENQAFLPFETEIKTWESIVNSGNVNNINITIVDSINSLIQVYQQVEWVNNIIYDQSNISYPIILKDFPSKEYTQIINQLKTNNSKEIPIPNLDKFLTNTLAVDYYTSVLSFTQYIDRRFKQKIIDKEKRLIELIEEELD